MTQASTIDPRLFGATPALRGPEPDARPEAAKIREVAQQFEAMLLAQMLRDLQPAMSGEREDSDNSFTFGPLADAMSVELSLALSRAGGMGLADALTRALDRQAPSRRGLDDALHGLREVPPALAMPVTDGTESVATPAAGASPAPVAPSFAPRISSAFGWRTDPINGQARFHHGTDVPLVNGHEVRAAAAGTIKSVDEHSGYGLLVVVAHENGVETRYAHLSAADVRPGDTVARGDVIARAGSSGRATGPHLHFEVREGGRSVDPGGWLDAVLTPPVQ